MLLVFELLKIFNGKILLIYVFYRWKKEGKMTNELQMCLMNTLFKSTTCNFLLFNFILICFESFNINLIYLLIFFLIIVSNFFKINLKLMHLLLVRLQFVNLTLILRSLCFCLSLFVLILNEILTYCLNNILQT